MVVIMSQITHVPLSDTATMLWPSIHSGTTVNGYCGEMKKVNKQCLLDTPRTVRVSEINLASYSSNQQTLVLKKNSVESVQQKLFFPNQTPSCIRSMWLHRISKVSNCSIKSCSRSWSAHESTINAYTKAQLGENCLSSQSCHFVNFFYFQPDSFMHMFNVPLLYRQSIKLLH